MSRRERGRGLVDYVDVASDDPRLLAVRDTHPEPFTDLAPLPELVRDLELACRMGRIGRALTWQLVAITYPGGPDGPGEFDRVPFRVLSSLLKPAWLGMDGVWRSIACSTPKRMTAISRCSPGRALDLPDAFA